MDSEEEEGESEKEEGEEEEFDATCATEVLSEGWVATEKFATPRPATQPKGRASDRRTPLSSMKFEWSPSMETPPADAKTNLAPWKPPLRSADRLPQPSPLASDSKGPTATRQSDSGFKSSLGGHISKVSPPPALVLPALSPNEGKLQPTDNLPPIASYDGFTTGTGKKIVVSEEARRRGQALIDSVTKEDVGLDDLAKRDVGDELAAAASAPSTPAGGAPKRTYGGFATGTGKKIVVSEEARRRGQALIDSVAKEDVGLDDLAKRDVGDELAAAASAPSTPAGGAPKR
eukprot:UC1_evm1s594